MVKDFRYIIKRILVGTGIALLLSFIRGNLALVVNAKEISSVSYPTTVTTVTNLDTRYNKDDITSGSWANWGSGYLYFNFSLTKVSGSATSPVVAPKAVLAFSGSNYYVCDAGSTTAQNSTFDYAFYSVKCPMKMGSSGLTMVSILFQDNQQNSSSTYRLYIGGVITFEQADDVSVSVDTSGTTNAINNQIVNDNSNANKIIDSQNKTTEAIEEQTDAIKEQTEETKKQVEETQKQNDFLMDDSDSDVDSSFFEDFETDSNSPVSDLLTMPITLLQAYINGFDSSCSSFNLGSLYGHNLIFPCLNLEKYLGSNLWALIDSLFCIFMVYNIGMLCVQIYEGITSLNDDMQMLYSPQHVASPTSRVERNSDLY